MSINIRQTFNLESLLSSAGLRRTIMKCRAGELIFSEGDATDSIIYVQKGNVKLSVFSKTRQEGVVGILGPGDFFGEGCLTSQPSRTKNATAMTPSTLLVIAKAAMMRLLRTEPLLLDRFLAHLLSRNIRIQEDLVDQLLSSCERRLARVLLLLACYGKRTRKPRKILPTISQGTLAGMVGTSRPHVNLLLKKFKTLGLINMDGTLTVNPSLRHVVSPGPSRSAHSRASLRTTRRRAANRKRASIPQY